jgi:hypothetical protein
MCPLMPRLARLFKRSYHTNEKELGHPENDPWDFVETIRRPGHFPGCYFRSFGAKKLLVPMWGLKWSPLYNTVEHFNCWYVPGPRTVAKEPHRSTFLNLEHCPLKANASCLLFPLHQGKMNSIQPLSGLDSPSPSQGSRGQLTSTPPYHYHSPLSRSPFKIGKATRAHPALLP